MAKLSFLQNYTLVKSQFAEDGKWEEAIEIEFPGDLSALDKRRSIDTAIEFFFKNSNQDIAFIGFRLKKYPSEHQNKIMEDCLKQLQIGQSFETVQSKIGEALNINNFLSTPPDFLEIGAEGFWQTYGSKVVWKNDDTPALTISEIKAQAPQLLETFKRPMMLEIAWKDPIPTWLALQVSDTTDKNLFCFSEKRYQYYLEKVIQND